MTPSPRFDTLLVANRGEIARRVVRSARGLGLRTVAVFSDADRAAPHVREADVAVRLGPAPARESYLRTDAVLQAALDTGAGAVHPGYGFLSENVEFARACEDAGLAFVGPTPRPDHRVRQQAHRPGTGRRRRGPDAHRDGPARLRRGGRRRRRARRAARDAQGHRRRRRDRHAGLLHRRTRSGPPTTASSARPPRTSGPPGCSWNAWSARPATSRSRSSATGRAGSPSSATATAPCSGATRRSWRRPRPPRCRTGCASTSPPPPRT